MSSIYPVLLPNVFEDMLVGDNAFYKQPQYTEIKQREFSQIEPLAPMYEWNTEHKIMRVVKVIFSIIIFPIYIYQILHSLVAALVLPSSIAYSDEDILSYRMRVCHDNRAWKMKRISVACDGYTIDAMIMGKPDTFANRRWALISDGNGELYETSYNAYKPILQGIGANAIFFHYPGVGSSNGPPSRLACAKAYRAMLRLLEDDERGIGAREIIGIGHSIGGGVQADALVSHELRTDKKYVFVKSRTFATLSQVAAERVASIAGLLVRLFGWNIDTAASSKKLRAPEIILQTADVEVATELTSSAPIRHDSVIAETAALATALLDDPACPRESKIFLGIPEGHNEEADPRVIVPRIAHCLS